MWGGGKGGGLQGGKGKYSGAVKCGGLGGVSILIGGPGGGPGS